MSKVLEVCVGCNGDCGFESLGEEFFYVPGVSVGSDKEEVMLTVKTEWLDRAVRKLGFACLDDFFYRDEDKDYILADLARMACDRL